MWPFFHQWVNLLCFTAVGNEVQYHPPTAAAGWKIIHLVLFVLFLELFEHWCFFVFCHFSTKKRSLACKFACHPPFIYRCLKLLSQNSKWRVHSLQWLQPQEFGPTHTHCRTQTHTAVLPPTSVKPQSILCSCSRRTKQWVVPAESVESDLRWFSDTEMSKQDGKSLPWRISNPLCELLCHLFTWHINKYCIWRVGSRETISVILFFY